VTFYGLRGYSHGATNLVTVMSRAGIAATLAALDYDEDDIRIEHYPGLLPQYHERRAGGLDRFIARHGIEILDFKRWSAKKRELGEVVYG